MKRLRVLFAGQDVEVDPALRPVQDIVTETLKAVEDELKLRGYSPKTRKAYRGHIRRFVQHVAKDPRQIEGEGIKAYLLELVEEKQVSRAYYNQAFSAIKFLYEQVYIPPS